MVDYKSIVDDIISNLEDEEELDIKECLMIATLLRGHFILQAEEEFFSDEELDGDEDETGEEDTDKEE